MTAIANPLNLAFEYHGRQHYKFNKFFHRKPEALAERKEDDLQKREICALHGVKLIEIPYTVTFGEMKPFIIESCKALKIVIPDEIQTKSIDIRRAFSPRKINMMQQYAKQRGGKCLSTHYIDAHTKLLWECKNGHRWWGKPNTIQQGNWCRQCSKKIWTIKDLMALANAHGGKCLSTNYKGTDGYYEWECARGHRWKGIAHNIIYADAWCRKCKGQEKRTIDEMRNVAASRGGWCLSDTYVNNKTKLKWKCNKGHTWMAAPNSVLRGSWCPKCWGIKSKARASP